MKCINVLGGIHSFDNFIFVDMFRKRHLYQYAMNFFITIEFVNLCKHIFLRGIFRHLFGNRIKPERFTRLCLIFHINFRRGIVADEYECEARSYAALMLILLSFYFLLFPVIRFSINF